MKSLVRDDARVYGAVSGDRGPVRSGRARRLRPHAIAIARAPAANTIHAIASLDAPARGACTLDTGNGCPAAAASRRTAVIAAPASPVPGAPRAASEVSPGNGRPSRVSPKPLGITTSNGPLC